MRGRKRRRSDRGQSVSINYILSLVIVTMLISGLFISVSGFLETQQERAARSELDVIGNRIAADIATADRLNRTAEGDAQVNVTTTVPFEVAGSGYSVEISSTSTSTFYDVEILLIADEVSVNRTVTVRTRSEVGASTISGGTYEVALVGSGGSQELEVRNAG